MSDFKTMNIFSYCFNNLFSCGVKTILDFTLALGIPGMMLTKSKTNSDEE
jgi:hypothetical protein